MNREVEGLFQYFFEPDKQILRQPCKLERELEKTNSVRKKCPL